MTGTLTSLLLPLALKSGAVLALAAGAAFLLRRRSAATRHLVWTLGVAGVLLLPLATVLSPTLVAVPLPQGTVSSTSTARDPVPTSNEVLRHAASPAPEVRAARPPAAAPRADERATLWNRIAVQPVAAAFAIWAAGTLVLLVRLLAGLTAVSRVVRRGRTIEDDRWHDRLEQAARQIGASPATLLLSSSETPLPMTCGIRRPVILLPAECDTWTEERAQVVLLHELAHVRRRDCLVHCAAQIMRALHWFNPLAWLAVNRLTAERERACDDLVLIAGTRGTSYAEHLLDIARSVRAVTPPAAALAMARPSELEGRLLAILDAARDRRPLEPRRWAAGALALAVLVAGLAGVRLDSSAEAAVVPGLKADAPRQSARPAAPAPTPTPTPAPAPTPAPTRAPRVAAPPPPPADARPFVPPQGPAGPARPEQAPAPVVAGERETDAERPAVPQKVIDGLVEALKDENQDVRRQALQVLVRFRSPLAFEPTLALLKDADPEMREHAAFALGQLDDQRAVAPLVSALDDPQPAVRQQAAFALGQLGAEAAVMPLIRKLTDEQADVRRQAAFALGQLGDERAVDALTAALKDQDADVRQTAAFALGQVVGGAGEKWRSGKVEKWKSK